MEGYSRKWEQEVPKPEAGACLEPRSNKAKVMRMGEEKVNLFERLLESGHGLMGRMWIITLSKVGAAES